MKTNTSEVMIRNIRFNDRSAKITWSHKNHNTLLTSMLYQHSDDTWHFDCNTQKYDEEVQNQLMTAYSDRCADIAYKRLASIKEEVGYTGVPSRLQRIESLLYKEERYQEAMRQLRRAKKMATVPDAPEEGRIHVWHQETEMTRVFRA